LTRLEADFNLILSASMSIHPTNTWLTVINRLVTRDNHVTCTK